MIISTTPLFAQAQQPDAAKLKADARNLVGIIGSDKTKTKTYCQITNLGEQMNEAVQAKDTKKAVELARKLPELQKYLGPEYLGLLESLRNANLTPKDVQEIVSMFDTLDESWWPRIESTEPPAPESWPHRHDSLDFNSY